ncbi:hypothetical protein BH09GEM1_BH09GEM1_14050 [soil metagenome]
MNAAWMLSSATAAVLFAATALVVARVAALYRGVPLRWIWTLATVASIAITLLWLRPAASQVVRLQSLAPASSVRGTPRVETPRVGASNAAMPSAAVTASTSKANAPMSSFYLRLPTIPEPVGRVLRYAWIAMSLGFLTIIAFASRRIRRERSGWQQREIAEVPVFVSQSFGPALVGVVKPSIVLPEWVLSLDEKAQRAIVAHENEHRAAHDPALILLGLIAVVLMPWNPGLWMLWRGLRRAIELDCDERVVRRGIEGDEYARVLLHAWKTARGSWLPSTAFAERASGLGARVEHLMRPEPRGRAMRTLLGAAVAGGFVFVACSTPAPQLASSPRAGTAPYPLVVIDGVQRPDLPPRYRYVGPVVAETLTTPSYRVVYRGKVVEDSTARMLYPTENDSVMMQTLWAPSSVVHFGEPARYGAVLYYTAKYRRSGGAIIAPGEGDMAVRAASNQNAPAADVAPQVYANLFNDITLPANTRTRALAIISAEYTQQRALHGPTLLMWPKRIELHTARDADLRALLTDDADRARFDVRSREGRMPSITVDMVAQNMYTNFFQNPVPDPETKARALSIISTSLNDDVAAYRRAPDDLAARLALRDKRDAALRPLLSDEDRVRFDKIVSRMRDAEIKP